ncbi:DUF1707 and DUF4190 domain-containing protein [Phytoactinopolyspora mesophila]|uniref:DUF1707 domain-containing protein n=1 Tax=Phytoactinopolyspora mesophila TaxID=2650750 RepID=A0A7K3M9K2_9ACTN|nr:DUF1707 and DUF4190 domain-containing protein [Phytoactinopolyspora mesophila]NDL59642.1 DUF1707 domain-containing protein [Phytoactinopolyspora mesophila]
MNAEGWRTMRASDADRDRAADLVKAALAEGRITWEEHSSRLQHVLNSRTYGELDHAVRDLPSGVLPHHQAPLPAAPGHPMPPAYAPTRSTNGYALASVICGGAGFMTGISAIAAIITGHIALSQIKRTGEEGRGMAVAGLVMGYVVTVGGALMLILMLGLFFAVGTSGTW